MPTDVKSTKIEIDDDGTINLIADVEYQNKGLLKDGEVRSATLTYTTILKPTDGVLPQFAQSQLNKTAKARQTLSFHNTATTGCGASFTIGWL